MARGNTPVVPQAAAALDKLKFEVAQELGVTFGAYNGNLTTREAGSVGGSITKRLVQIAEQSLAGRNF
jgi:hypothetical protein